MRTRITEMAADMIKQVTQQTFSMKPELLDEIDKRVGWEESDEEARIYCREAVLKGDLNVIVDNSQHMRMFTSIEKFGNLFYGQDWVVYVSKDERTFITTDNPVAMHIPKVHGFYGPTFLERTHYFSLTPNICIIARPPDTFDGKKFHRKTLYPKNWMQIMDLNYTIGGYAYQYAYSCDKTGFEDILKALALEEKLAEFQLRQKIRNQVSQSTNG